MKKIIFIAIILFSGIQISNAQHSISTNYTNNYIGHDFDLNYNYMIKKHKVLIGTSFLLNQKFVQIQWCKKNELEVDDLQDLDTIECHYPQLCWEYLNKFLQNR